MTLTYIHESHKVIQFKGLWSLGTCQNGYLHVQYNMLTFTWQVRVFFCFVAFINKKPIYSLASFIMFYFSG